MVQLKEMVLNGAQQANLVSIPNGSIKRLIFHVLLLTIFWFQFQMVQLKVPSSNNQIPSMMFQFQMVQLKDSLNNYVKRHQMSFQFQMVQLKVGIMVEQTARSLSFNSKWFN